MVNWAKDNAVLASLVAITIPLVLGILLGDWRHGFWPCREDDRWEDETQKDLACLPSHLFRFMYDEYYYYVEFDGNSSLAVALSGLFVFLNYLRTSEGAAILALIVSAILSWLLWRSWNKSLAEFFEDVRITKEGLQRRTPADSKA